MSWESKVVWNEGLFLQPHHFQQHDRYVEGLVSGLARGMAPYPWGVSSLTIDTELLKLGKISISDCAGLTPDGAPFRVPQTDNHPEALIVPTGTRDCTVHLTVPTRRHGAQEVDMGAETAANSRFRASELEIVDTMGPDRRPVTVAVGKTRLSLRLDVDDLSDLLPIPIARIIEVRPDGQVVLDRAFIPSCLDLRVSETLYGFMRELEGMLSQRADALVARVGGGGTRGTAEIADFLLLIAINRAMPAVRHLSSIETVHPALLYHFLASLAGELASFMSKERKAPSFPAYRHQDLTETFQPVMRALKQYLSAVTPDTAIQIPIEARRYGISVAQITDKRLLASAGFVLAAKADVAAETVRSHFPGHAKLGPVETIRQLVNSALPGIPIRPMAVAPRQIPYHAGFTYFEIDRAGSHWQQLAQSGGLAVHVPEGYPGLVMELWAIREG
ncbi:MAG: type VI secretion system baseplate subunit TssK [Pseudomonadota bacterium]